MKQDRSAFSQSGFTLLEAIVAIGLAGLGGIALMSFQKNTLMGQKTIYAQDDARVSTGDIAMLLSNRLACTNTFGGLVPSVANTKAAAIKDSHGQAKYIWGDKYVNRTLSLHGISLGGAAGALDPSTHLPFWQMNSPTTGTAIVLLDWKQTGNNGNRGNGPGDLNRFFIIDAMVDAATMKITSCVARIGAAPVSTPPGTPGLGLVGYVPIWTGTTGLGNSVVFQDATGNIGIGTSAPADKFQVNGGITMQSDISAGLTINNPGTDGNNWAIVNLAGAANAGGMQFYNASNAAESMRITNAGRVGIGTTDPLVELDVNGTIRLMKNAAPPFGCDPAHDGAISQTSINTLCLCNGADWVTPNDGATICGWTAPPPPTFCPAATISNCDLLAVPSGGTSGTCSGGYSGVCNYSCASTAWTKVTNTCVLIPPPPPPPTCKGYSFNGFCYYFGGPGLSCDQACSGQGAACDPAGLEFIGGPSGTDALCQAVAGAIGPAGSRWGGGAPPSVAKGLGCFNEAMTGDSIVLGSNYRDRKTAVTCGAKLSSKFNPASRYCACDH